jgi:hypothetical protein
MQYVVIGQGHWGKGPDIKTARRNWMRQGASLSDGGYNIISFPHDDALMSVDAWGNINYRGDEPTVVKEVPPTRR